MDSPLGDMSVAQFLAEYWQKQPLLIREGVPAFTDPLSPDELAGLACEAEVESRLVLGGGAGPWSVEHGPFPEARFASLAERDWSLLVQAVDHYVPEVAELRSRFRFLPDFRIDDVMVSFAPVGGGVGPHFDQYDVFLVQGQGERRWQLGERCSPQTPVVPDAPLCLLSDFQPSAEYTLRSGDILYVPPQVPHFGIAVNECMTYSVGFRAPSYADLLFAFAMDKAKELGEWERYEDRDLSPQAHPGELTRETLERVERILRKTVRDESAIADWFGVYTTEPKYPSQDSEATDEQAGALRSQDDECLLSEVVDAGRGLVRDPASRIAFIRLGEETRLFVNGERCPASAELAILLADREAFDASELPTPLEARDRALIATLLRRRVLVFV